MPCCHQMHCPRRELLCPSRKSKKVWRMEGQRMMAEEHKQFLVINLCQKFLQIWRIILYPIRQNVRYTSNVAGCWLGDLIEAETPLCVHGGVCRHPDLGGWDHEVVTHKVELMITSGFVATLQWSTAILYNNIETLPECKVTSLPVLALHLWRVRKE